MTVAVTLPTLGVVLSGMIAGRVPCANSRKRLVSEVFLACLREHLFYALRSVSRALCNWFTLGFVVCMIVNRCA